MLTNPNKELYLKGQRGSGFFMDNLAQSRLEVTNRCFADNRNVPFYLEGDMRDKLGRFIKGNKQTKEYIKKRVEKIKKWHKNNPDFFKGENHPNWKGGRYIHTKGYWFILKPEHPYCRKKGYILEHRIIIEKYLGRYLQPKEECHHINGNKLDNRLQNLMAFKNHSSHLQFENKNILKDVIFDGRNIKKCLIGS